jgi:hypothetical protein
MFVVDTNKEDVLNDFPFVMDWINTSKVHIIKKEIDESKIEFYYSYGFFVPKVDKKEEMYIKMYEDSIKMKFPERLEFELSKVRVNLTMKIGNFILSNRLEKGSIPEIIRKIVTEITKVKMIVESEYNENDEVRDSIPDIDHSIISFEIIRDAVKSDYSESQSFDVDSILDKIATQGMDSLSDDERDFLDKKSKDL